MTSSEQVIQIASRLYEMRRFARDHLGNRYEEIVAPIRARLRASSEPVLSAMHAEISAAAQAQLTGPAFAVVSAAIGAAALDILDPGGIGEARLRA